VADWRGRIRAAREATLPSATTVYTRGAMTMSGDNEIKKGDIVEHKSTGQTWRVVSNVAGQLRVKGNGMSTTLLLNEVVKAPPRP
jgi:hypothetical protein